jgi:putative type I site-specific restriction-modification system, S subunit
MKSVVCSAVTNMKDSGIKWLGMVPKHWVKGILSSYFYQQKELNLDLREQNLLSLSYGKIIDKDITTKDGLLPKSFDNYNVIQKGDIVFRLTDLQNDKKSLRTGLCKRNGIITSAYVTIRKKIELCPDFFAYLFHVYDICKVYYGLGSGVRQGLNFNELKKLPLILPPTLAEQRVIADWLDAKCADIDAAIELQQRMIDKLKAYKTAVIHQSVTKGLDKNANLKDSGVQWIGEVPEHWEVCHLGSIFKENVRLNTEEKETNALQFRLGEIISKSKGNSKYIPISLSGYNIVEPNVIMINGLNLSFDFISQRVALVKERGVITSTYIAIAPSCYIEDENTTSRYACYLLKAYDTCKVLHSMGRGLRATLSYSTLSKMPILLPPLSEQRAIADWLDAKCADIDATIALKEQKQEKLKAYKKTIIFEYVTGKKQVANINKQL